MGEAAPSEVTQVAAATTSQDPEVGLAAVAALRGLVEVLEALQGENACSAARSCAEALSSCTPSPLCGMTLAQAAATIMSRFTLACQQKSWNLPGHWLCQYRTFGSGRCPSSTARLKRWWTPH